MRRPSAIGETAADLPLLSKTPRSWAELAATKLSIFMADHAVCEQQAALSALSLIGHYPDDEELVERLTSLAMEEVSHLRRVTTLLRQRGIPAAKRRPNPYVQGLKGRMRTEREPELKTDRLLVCALIEARSCERFTRLLEVVEDPELKDLLHDLGPAEQRHWQWFHRLATRGPGREAADRRWQEWLRIEDELISRRGVAPTVHG